jgi:hypothetical protein
MCILSNLTDVLYITELRLGFAFADRFYLGVFG